MTWRYNLILPEINLPPLAWRIISSLGGSPTTYAQVTRLMALVDVNTYLCATDLVTRTRSRRGRTMGSEEKVETYQRTTRYDDVVLPELNVAAAWVVIMKMAYGLDGRER
jgi:RNA polymerase I-specific transcription initiation factor RRN7